jgi:uncharacterized protein
MSYPEARPRRARRAKFHIEKNSLGEFLWRFKAAGGEVVVSGESCKNKADCKRAIELLKRYAADADVLDQTIPIDAAVSKR